MKSNTDKGPHPSAPTCWQREAPCACLRIETSAREARLFPYQHFVTASLNQGAEGESLRLLFSTHDVEIVGRNLRPLLLALQDFAVKWIRAVPERYQGVANERNGWIASIRIEEANTCE